MWECISYWVLKGNQMNRLSPEEEKRILEMLPGGTWALMLLLAAALLGGAGYLWILAASWSLGLIETVYATDRPAVDR
jgi:hypothetical protein